MSTPNNKPYNVIKEKKKSWTPQLKYQRRETITSKPNSTPYNLNKKKKKSWTHLSKYQQQQK